MPHATMSSGDSISSAASAREGDDMIKKLPHGAAPAVIHEIDQGESGRSVEGADEDAAKYKSSAWDERDMQRLGRKQELTRHFRALSIMSFTVIVQATWEFVIVSMYQGLYDGGTAGMIWGFAWNFLGFLPIVASLAEMASIAPTSGGQYHWVSEFAPVKYQKVLSYFAGWQSTLAWQAGNAAGPFVTGTLIQALIFVGNDSYSGTNWQGTLLVIANVVVVYLANLYGTKLIPFVQNGLLAMHILLFFAVIIPLWILAPHPPARDVFFTFYDGGRWGDMGLTVLVGQISAIYGCLGSDAAAHMAEEVRDAGRTVPVAMMSSYILNGVLGLVVVVTICFCLPDLRAALAEDYQMLYAFRQAMSDGWAITLSSGIIVLIFASNVSYLASTARETFAFARDRGLPFSGWVSTVHPTRHIPANSLLLTSVISIALSLIYIGNDTAFFAIVSLNVVALMLTYFLSIACMLWRRIAAPDTLPPARWSLGRWGVPINAMGMGYAFWAFFWGFWPERKDVRPANFNWAVLMFGFVTIVSVLSFVTKGRRVYAGPVVLVEGRSFLLKPTPKGTS